MELLVTRCHFLNKIMSYGISTCYLGQEFGIVGIHILDNGFPIWLVVYDRCSNVSLQGQGHCKGGSLGLCGIMCIELFDFNFSFILIRIIEDDDFHWAFERSWVLEVNEETSFADFVLGFLSCLSQWCFKFCEFFRLNSLSSFFSNLVCSTWCFNF